MSMCQIGMERLFLLPLLWALNFFREQNAGTVVFVLFLCLVEHLQMLGQIGQNVACRVRVNHFVGLCPVLQFQRSPCHGICEHLLSAGFKAPKLGEVYGENLLSISFEIPYIVNSRRNSTYNIKISIIQKLYHNA